MRKRKYGGQESIQQSPEVSGKLSVQQFLSKTIIVNV